jgi:hypothetical protein
MGSCPRGNAARGLRREVRRGEVRDRPRDEAGAHGHFLNDGNMATAVSFGFPVANPLTLGA